MREAITLIVEQAAKMANDLHKKYQASFTGTPAQPEAISPCERKGGLRAALFVWAYRGSSAALQSDLIECMVWQTRWTTKLVSSMSELVLQKMARDLCRSEGYAWSPKDFENGVPGVTMLTVVADEKKRREYLNRAKGMLKRNSR